MVLVPVLPVCLMAFACWLFSGGAWEILWIVSSEELCPVIFNFLVCCLTVVHIWLIDLVMISNNLYSIILTNFYSIRCQSFD